MSTREKLRDDRDFDTTQLHENSHGAMLHRDYSAHFFRWSFAKRFIKPSDDVLDVGCGSEFTLGRLLTGGGPAANVNKYVGVDLGPIKASKSKRLDLNPEFDFTARYGEILEKHGQFDVITNFEVIEHMLPVHGERLLAAIRACLKPEGKFLISTPCYDGKRHAANHIHEYTVPELKETLEAAGFEVVKRYGTFMDIKNILKEEPEGCDRASVKAVWDALSPYYNNDALSCFFAPLFPDFARNNLWVCKLK